MKPTSASMAVLRYLFVGGTKSAAEVGQAVWGGRRRGRVASARGGGDYAAQMLLGRLRRQGLVRVSAHSAGCDASLWELTDKGREALVPDHRRRRNIRAKV